MCVCVGVCAWWCVCVCVFLFVIGYVHVCVHVCRLSVGGPWFNFHLFCVCRWVCHCFGLCLRLSDRRVRMYGRAHFMLNLARCDCE